MSLFRLGEETMRRSADISGCGRYRYSLTREWGAEGGKIVNFIMLNPSTADSTVDDATVRRCIGFAKAWGYGRLVVTNLFAFRATDPGAMKAAADPVGPDNDDVIRVRATVASLVVVAWGVHGTHRGREAAVHRALSAAGVATLCLGVTKAGRPKHPLYVPASTQPQPWSTP